MVAEMTGNLSLLAPAMIAVGISSIIVGKDTIYTSQVDTRADSPAHRLQLSFPLLSTLAVRQAMAPLSLRFFPEQSVAEAEKILIDKAESGAPVVDRHNNLQGVLTLVDIQQVPLTEREKRTVGEIMNRKVLVAYPDETLDEALEQLTSHRVSWMPVLDVEARLHGRVAETMARAVVVAVHAERKCAGIAGSREVPQRLRGLPRRGVQQRLPRLPPLVRLRPLQLPRVR